MVDMAGRISLNIVMNWASSVHPLFACDVTGYTRKIQYFPLIYCCSLMKTKPVLTLEDVKKIAAAAEAEAIANKWAVVISICDDGGHLLWLQRLDGAAPISSHIAPQKAKTAALGKRASKIYEDLINNGRYSFLSAPELQGMLEGGEPIIVDGECVGAVGVSGVKSSEDVQIARAGIAALGL